MVLQLCNAVKWQPLTAHMTSTGEPITEHNRAADCPVGPRTPPDIAAILSDVTRGIVIVRSPHGPAIVPDTARLVGTAGIAAGGSAPDGVWPTANDAGPAWPLLAYLPPLPPERLGDPGFLVTYGVRYPYMSGAMANGIASTRLVIAMSRAGMLGSFGAAGLSLERIAAAVDELQSTLGSQPYCVNLIHSPNEPAHEMAVAELLVAKRVRCVEASAYLDLTPAVVYYRLASPENRLIAKVSRVEVASKFLGPPPERLVRELLATGRITESQAQAAARRPLADDLTVEADSGGHTDNRPAICLLPTMLALRDRLSRQYGYSVWPRVGLAGGIATPAAAAAAFAMGAAYIVTGSINQACIESGTSDLVRQMLAAAGQADVTMAPAADMFEMGVKVQVLKRGTMFPMRAHKLYELYRAYPSWEAIPVAERQWVEKTCFRATFEDIWQQTEEFFRRRDPAQLQRAARDPKHRLALAFRWYLGLSSRWANAGVADRQLDFQVWCGPAMGAFNEWVKGSFLEEPHNRSAVTVALNLLYGACLLLRRQMLQVAGLSDWAALLIDHPLPREEIERRLRGSQAATPHQTPA